MWPSKSTCVAIGVSQQKVCLTLLTVFRDEGVVAPRSSSSCTQKTHHLSNSVISQWNSLPWSPGALGHPDHLLFWHPAQVQFWFHVLSIILLFSFAFLFWRSLLFFVCFLVFLFFFRVHRCSVNLQVLLAPLPSERTQLPVSCFRVAQMLSASKKNSKLQVAVDSASRVHFQGP